MTPSEQPGQDNDSDVTVDYDTPFGEDKLVYKIIVSPDESRGYYGFTHVVRPPPPPQSESFPEATDHNFLLIAFILGTYLQLANRSKRNDFELLQVITLGVRSKLGSKMAIFFIFLRNSPTVIS
jgi:hypothetical protein